LAGEATGEAADGVGDLVHAEQVRGLFAKSPLPFATVLAVSAIVVLALWDTVDRRALGSWAGALWFVTASRVALHIAYVRRAPRPEKARAWGTRFTIGTFAGGMTWGAGGLFLFPRDLPSQTLLAFVIGGMCAGASSSTSTYPRAFAAFSAPAIIPITLRMAFEGGRVHLTMAAMLALFAIAMTIIARTGARSFLDSTRLRFQNAALARAVTAAHEHLEERVRERTNALAKEMAERKRAEEALAVRERMASVGALAAGVAHEINNPLAFVIANQAFIAERLGALADELADTLGATTRDALAEALAALTDAQTGAERVRNTVADLRKLASENDGQSHVIDPTPVLEAAIRVATTTVRRHARLVTEIGRMPSVLANEAQLGQVILNLLTNAAQAIDGPEDANTVRIAARTGDGGAAVVEVHDTGHGIAPEVLPRIFDPFFTTRQSDFGNGSSAGLGLPICHRIVTALGGRITVESAPGRTVFRVILPAAPPVTPPPASMR
jgi:signal transduction histidine kinase